MDIKVKEKEEIRDIEVMIASYLYIEGREEQQSLEPKSLKSIAELQSLVSEINLYNIEQQKLYDSGKTIYLQMKKILSK